MNLGELSGQNADVAKQLNIRDRNPMLAPVFHMRAGWLSPVKKVGLDAHNRVLIVSAFPWPWLVLALVAVIIVGAVFTAVGYDQGLRAAIVNIQLPTK